MREQTDRVASTLGRTVRKELFVKLESTRKRVIVQRQLTLLNYLLDQDGDVEWSEFRTTMHVHFKKLKQPFWAMARDIGRLVEPEAISILGNDPSKDDRWPTVFIRVNLDWPSMLTETDFFERLKKLPRSKTYGFLAPSQ